jgi:hypothetical protein
MLFVGALVIVLVTAVGLSQVASDQPDGLEFVAEQEGFAGSAEEHDLAEAPLAGYGENLDGTESTNVALAGLVGVAVTLGLGFGVFWLVRAGGSPPESAGS